jgi:hypothetical protein
MDQDKSLYFLLTFRARTNPDARPYYEEPYLPMKAVTYPGWPGMPGCGL